MEYCLSLKICLSILERAEEIRQLAEEYPPCLASQLLAQAEQLEQDAFYGTLLPK